MSGIKDLYQDIEQQLTRGRTASIIAADLDVPVHWVYEVQDDLYAELPDIVCPTEEEMQEMACHYKQD
jgi:hypothetical protein